MPGRPIPGYPGYLATDEGEIVGRRMGRPLKPRADASGRRVRVYLPVLPPREGTGWRWKDVYAHVLVCLAYHGPRPPGAVALRLDGDPSNTTPGNLRWGSRTEAQIRARARKDKEGP